VPKAEFTFKPLKNSFSVHVKNLEKLSVEQIQKIQDFVARRKGVFSFDTYTFSIQKKIGLEEFENLLNLCGIEAIVEELFAFDDAPRVSFGQYKGMLYKELPDSYLLWLKGNYNGSDKSVIEKELQDRNL
jgi:hypothetical protein